MSTERSVTTDDKTIWINGKVCLGRFSERAAEVFDEAGEKTLYAAKHPDLDEWYRFVRAVAHHHDVTVGSEHTPDWLRKRIVDRATRSMISASDRSAA